MSKSFGIDFGTTNTYLAVDSDGSINMGLEAGLPIPTAVIAKYEQDKKWIYVTGNEVALENTKPFYGRTFKRDIGLQKAYPFGNTDKTIEPEVLMAAIFKRLQNEARETNLIDPSEQINNVTITHPAHWGPDRRSAIKYAAKLAGFEDNIHTLEEPIAAFISEYERLNKASCAGKIIVLFDIGGGTTDVAIVKIPQDVENERPTVKTRHSISVGGEDVDQYLIDRIFPKDALETIYPHAQQKLREEVQYAKIRLSEIFRRAFPKPQRVIDEKPHNRLRYILNHVVQTAIVNANNIFFRDQPDTASDFSQEISYADLDEAVNSTIIIALNRLFEETVLKKVNLDEIAYVILVGGSSNLPQVKLWVSDAFGSKTSLRWKSGIFLSTSPSEAIARGAALHERYIREDKSLVTPTLQQTIWLCTDPMQFYDGHTSPKSLLKNKNISIILADEGQKLPFPNNDWERKLLKPPWATSEVNLLFLKGDIPIGGKPVSIDLKKQGQPIIELYYHINYYERLELEYEILAHGIGRTKPTIDSPYDFDNDDDLRDKRRDFTLF